MPRRVGIIGVRAFLFNPKGLKLGGAGFWVLQK
jgi:hypothetical protein